MDSVYCKITGRNVSIPKYSLFMLSWLQYYFDDVWIWSAAMCLVFQRHQVEGLVCVVRFMICGLQKHADRLCGLVIKSPWLQIQRSRVRFPELPDFLRSSRSARGPLSLASITEEPLEWKIEINGRGDPLLWPRDTHYPQKSAVTSPTSGGRSVRIETDFRVLVLQKHGGPSFCWTSPFV
jgi:hypothetical protein